MSEYKVLLVDDEQIIRDGLKSFDWARFSCRVVGDADGGEAALLMAQALKPDIALLDIKMPGMDGLTCASHLKRINPDIEILLLTGYDRFDFAQQALRIGVNEYLLKPTDFQEMERVIQRLIGEIERRRARQAAYADALRMYEQARPMILSQLAQTLLTGQMSSRQDIEKTLDMLKIRLPKFIVVVAEIEHDAEVARRTGLEQGPFAYAVRGICEDIIKRHAERVLTQSNLDHCAFILSYPADAESSACLALCERGCSEVQAEVRQMLDCTISFGISDAGTDVYEINRYYSQALGACRQKLFFDGGSVIQYRDTVRGELENWILRDSERRHLLSALVSGDEQGVRQLMHTIGGQIGSLKPTLESIRIGMLELAVTAVKSMGEMFDVGPGTQLTTLYEGIECIYSCDSAESLIETVERILVALSRRGGELAQDYHRHTVKAILEHLSVNYMHDLSMDRIAQKFSLSGAYITKLLKKHTGKSFQENLIDIRLGEARALLEHGNHKVYEIAAMVGYQDYSYFVSAFKKKYGITPKKYKNSVQAIQ